MKKATNILINILSMSFVFFAYLKRNYISKDEYSIALQFLVIFILNAVLYLANYRKDNLICFEFFFSMAFLLSVFQYPFLQIFWPNYIINEYFFIPKSIYVEGICLAMAGYLFFLLGATLVARPGKHLKYESDHIELKDRYDRYDVSHLNCIFQYSTLFLFLVVLVLGGRRLLFQYSTQEFESWGGVGDLPFLVFMSFNISNILEFIILKKRGVTSIRAFIFKADKVYLINAFSIIIFLILWGNRSELLSLVLPILLLYSTFIRRLKKREIILLLFFGVIILNAIKVGRSEPGGMLNLENVSSSLANFNKISFIFEDLRAANGSIFFFIDHVNMYGISGGKNAVLQIASVIPFLQSMIIRITGFNPDPPSSIVYTTRFHGANFASGLGTHIIGDLYYTFGISGIIFLMALLGIIVGHLYNRVFLTTSKNLYLLLVNCILFGNSVYCVRVEYFYILRMIGFSVIALWLCNLILKIK